MSLRDDKKNIFTTIGSFTSVIQTINATDTTNLFPSINNKDDIVPFMLDTLKVVVGTDALQELTGLLFTKFIDGIEPKMKTALKKQVVQFNSSDNLPTQFTVGAGYSIPMKDGIDVDGKLKISPTSEAGNLLYDNVNPNFDSILHDAIVSADTDKTFGVLNMNYNSANDKVILKANITGTAPNIGNWANQYVDSLTIINRKEILSNVMNKMYGCITKDQNKTVEEVYQELIVDKLLEQLINGDDSFEILPEDSAALLIQAQDLVAGVINYDMGCGILVASLPLSGLTNLITNTTNSTDPFYVGNQINDTINAGITDQTIADENKETIKDGFFQKLIKFLTLALAKAISTAPQIRALLSIISAFTNNGIAKISKAKDDLKQFKTFIKCLINEAMKLINEFIFNLVVKYLVMLLKPVIQKIVKEKINQFKNIVKSLIPAKITSLVDT